MGSVNFNNLKNTSHSQKNYTYTDIYLDFAQKPFEIFGSNRTVNGKGRDMKVAFDINAIKNSLLNLFNTLPGERILLPDYGCDLRQFIFDPITDMMTRHIGRIIQTSISKWEPRVRIVNINVDGYAETNEYVITLTLEVPFLARGETLNIKGLLNKKGFTV
jgi:phage baseplate assembly protein W